jgi:shikimate kinase
VFLVGFMGSGKSSVGQALASHLGWPFIDLDERIEQREGRTIPEIFREEGEGGFRRIERRELSQLLSRASHPKVVALGGGAFVQAENAELIQNSGVTTVFLDASAEVLWQRCIEDPQERPLRQSFEQFAELYRQRHPHYLRAACRIDSSNKSTEQIAGELAVKLRSGQIVDQENSR